jgi:amino-acid N-acetyltransferase
LLPGGVTDLAPAAPADLEGIKRLLEARALPNADLTELHLAHFIVARNGDQLAGVVGVEPRGEAGLLRSLAVRKSGSGLGRRLLSTAETHSRQAGIRELFLLTTGAEKFFVKSGYAPVPRSSAPREILETTEFRQMCPQSATCMRKEIAS